ncbi:MAG: OmpW family outer membrane protein [Dokdonella sp.]
MKQTTHVTLLALALGLSCSSVYAQSASKWELGVGVHHVNPDSDNGKLADGTLPLRIGSDTKPTFTLEYFLNDNLGIEVLAALPFKHDISIEGLGKVGSTKHLPPTVSLQYHFNRSGSVSPFVGAGINYTTFFSAKTSDALAASTLKLGDSWGLAAHVGADFAISDRSALRVDLRWMDINSKVKLDGVKLGTARIDPLIYGTSWIMKF